MPSVEGLTPAILWYTLVGLVGIGSLIILSDKVLDVFRQKKKRDELKAKPEDELAETISEMVLKKLEPKFKEIDDKLANDNALIKSHTRALEEHRDQINAIEAGNKVLCRGILALLSHEINGNSTEKLKASHQEITDYLIEK